MNPFDVEVNKQIQRLKEMPLSAIEKAVTLKRLRWLENNRSKVAGIKTPINPRSAFNLFFDDYMGVAAKDLEVIDESDRRITWRSKNPCPTLEAARQLEMDTRKVCRGAYEKSTQAFFSRLDPELRFVRDYQSIRPYSGHCLEQIVRLDYKALMEIAIREAKQSRLGGNKGYGAVVALGEKILAQAHDTAFINSDPSQHAEMNAIRKAATRIGDGNLSGAVLISTCEPCPMCSSLAVWANISAIVYGASIEKTAARGKARIRVSSHEIVDKSPAQVEIISGVLEEQCLELY